MESLTKRDFDTLNLENIQPERKEVITNIKNSIVLSQEKTLEYAGDASKNLTTFSSDLLKTMKVKDVPEVEVMITELMSGLEKVDVDTLVAQKPSFFKKLFKVDELKQFMVKYDDVEGIIRVAKDKLENANFQLKKDIEVCNRYLEQNLSYINELDNYIMAGKLFLEEEKAKVEIERTSVDPEDMLAVHEINAKLKEIDRFERKLYNLELMRTIAVQNIPQIMLIKEGDSVLIEKIETSINSAIPLWESQMVIAIQLMRQKGALAIQKSVTNTTNELISKNSELLKTGSVEVAKELEAGIVDVEVLKKNSQNLIDTLVAIRSVHENGRQARANATKELGLLQHKLNEQLLLGDGQIK